METAAHDLFNSIILLKRSREMYRLRVDVARQGQLKTVKQSYVHFDFQYE